MSECACPRLHLHLGSCSRSLFLDGLLDSELLVFAGLRRLRLTLHLAGLLVFAGLRRLRLTLHLAELLLACLGLHLAGLLLACLGLVAAAAAALACLHPPGKVLIEIKVHGGRVALPRSCCGCNSTMRWARRQPVEHALCLDHVRVTETKDRSVATEQKGKQQDEVLDLDLDK
jgi:hypothetical protein